MKTVKQIGDFCKFYRKHILNLSAKELCKESSYNESNIYAFENGKANKVEYLQLYYNACKDDEAKTNFIKGVFENASWF